MNIFRFLVVGLLIVPATGASAADNAMTQTANGFFAAYATFHPSDGIPDAAGRAKYAPYTSPALDKLLAQAAAAQARFAKANKNSPPLLEGDLFTTMFEGATSYKVGACKGDGRKGSCAIDLVYDNKHDTPTHWTDTLYLVMSANGWRVDDIGYGGNWEYANHGRLTQTLHQAITDSGG